MKKGNLLAGLFAVVTFITLSFALNPTVFTDLKATNVQLTTLYDNASTPVARFVPGSTNALTGNLTVSGTFAPTGLMTVSSMTVTGTQGFKLSSFGATASSMTVVPSAVGIIMLDSSNLVYVSTSTTAGGVQRIGSQ